MLKLQNRLQNCVEFTKGHDVLIDIGTDHALLPVYAVLNNYVKKAYACDVSMGPLESAKKTIDIYNTTENVGVIKSDGFKNIDIDFDVSVIAGMLLVFDFHSLFNSW